MMNCIKILLITTFCTSLYVTILNADKNNLIDKRYEERHKEDTKKIKKDLSNENLSSSQIYKKILIKISNSEYDYADDLYNEFYRRFGISDNLRLLTLIMIDLSLLRKKYLLAKHYDELLEKKFASINNREIRKYLRIKIAFLSIVNTKVEQKRIVDLIQNVKNFKSDYKNSIYTDEIETYLVQLELGEYNINKDIVKYYKQVGKEKAASIYIKKEKKWIKSVKISKPDASYFIKNIFLR